MSLQKNVHSQNPFEMTGGCIHVFVSTMCLCVFMCIPAGVCEPVCYYCVYMGCTHICIYWPVYHRQRPPYLLSVTSTKEQEADSWQDAPHPPPFFFINITCTATKQSLGSLSADWLLLWAVVDRKGEKKKGEISALRSFCRPSTPLTPQLLPSVSSHMQSDWAL